MGVVVVAALGTACGASRSPELEALGPAADAVPVEPGRRCHYSDLPSELPPLERVLRAGSRGSLSLWGYGREPGDTIELSIRYGPTGALQWVRTIDRPEAPIDLIKGLDPGFAELERLVGEAVPRDGKPDWGVRLLVTSDGTPVEVLPAVVCEAYRVTRMPTPPPFASRVELAELRNASGHRVEVRLHLDDQGRIVDVELLHTSGSRLMDRYILALARDIIFRPWLHDGFPVAGHTTIRFDFDNR